LIFITITALRILFHFLEHWETNSQMYVLFFTFAAFYFWSAAWIFTNQFTFWFWTLWLSTLPITLGFFAYCFTLRFWGLAMSDTVRGFAYGNTLGAFFSLASFIGAHDRAVWSFAFNITNGIFWFLAAGVAFWGFANWGANGVAFGVVALPTTLWVASLLKCE